MNKCGVVAVCGFLVIGLSVNSASGLSKFKGSFDEQYVKESDNDEFKALFKKAGCNTCHIKGEKKDKRNAYGDELAKLIKGDANARLKEADKAGKKDEEYAKILQELKAAYPKAAEIKSDPKKDDSPTYGELIKAGKLPVPLPAEKD